MKRTYFMSYHTHLGKSWRIFSTEHNMATAAGLEQAILEFEERNGVPIVPLYWRELDQAEQEQSDE